MRGVFGFLKGFSYLYILSVENQIHTHMISQTKDRYVSPECEVLDVQPEGVIAASGEAPNMTPGWEWNF